MTLNDEKISPSKTISYVLLIKGSHTWIRAINSSLLSLPRGVIYYLFNYE